MISELELLLKQAQANMAQATLTSDFDKVKEAKWMGYLEGIAMAISRTSHISGAPSVPDTECDEPLHDHHDGCPVCDMP